MKQVKYSVGVLIVLIFLVTGYVYKHFPKDLAEISMGHFVEEDIITEALGEVGIFDFVILYDVFSPEGQVFVYSGNINLMFNTKNTEDFMLDMTDREVLMGEEFVKQNYRYNPLGMSYTSRYGEYKINGIVKNSKAIYYRDLSRLEDSNVRGQMIYTVLRDQEGNEKDYNSLHYAFATRGITSERIFCYRDFQGSLMKLNLLIALFCCGYFFVRYCGRFKARVGELFTKYSQEKKSTYFKEFFLNEKKNFELVFLILSILLIFTGVIIFLLITYINIRVPYSLNLTSPKSIYALISSFWKLLRDYLIFGMSRGGVALWSITVLYGGVGLMLLLGWIRRQFGK